MRKGERMEILNEAPFSEDTRGARVVGHLGLSPAWEALAAMELQLFAEGDGGDGDGDGTTGVTDSHRAESGEKRESESGGQSKSGGKDADAGQDLTREFEDLIKGRFKEEYSRRTQNIINRRFKEVKELEEFRDRYGESVERLGTLWGCPDDPEAFSRRAALLSRGDADGAESDGDVVSDTVGDVGDNGDVDDVGDEDGAASEAEDRVEVVDGLEVSSAEASALAARREIIRGIREMRREALWKSFEDGMRECSALYPSFDPAKEVKDGRFVSMLRGGASVVDAYRALHHGEILEGTVKASAGKIAEAVLAGVRSRGGRPSENGLSSRAGTRSRKAAASFTDSDINAILARVKNGEKVVL